MEKYKDKGNTQLLKWTEEKRIQTDLIRMSRNAVNLQQTIKVIHYYETKGVLSGSLGSEFRLWVSEAILPQSGKIWEKEKKKSSHQVQEVLAMQVWELEQ